MIVETTFETSALEEYLLSLAPGQRPSAARLLTLAQGEEELEQALEKGADLKDLPAYMDHSATAQRLHREAQLEQAQTLLQEFDGNDPLGMYLQELASIPVCGDTQLLAQQLLDGDGTAGEKLMNLSLSRVVELSVDYTGHGVLLLDLIQEGSMGLWTAIGNYEGGDFEAFRDENIRFAMEKAVVMQAYTAGLGQKLRQAVEDYRATDERLLTELGRNPTQEEIAEALHMEPAQALTVAGMLDAARDMVKARPARQEEQAQEDDQAVEDTAYFQMRQRILDMLSSLTEQEAQLLTLRYGLDGKKPMTAQETAAKLGLTTQQTVELEASALEKLRTTN